MEYQIFVNVNEPIGYIVEAATNHVYLIHINEGISYRVNHSVMDAEEEALQCVDNDSEIGEKLYAIVYGPQTAKDIEVQETVEAAMEMDVAPNYTQRVQQTAMELGEYVSRWSKEHGLQATILPHPKS